jgi:O-antigen/teichoic acid export membrane protein
MQECRYAQSDPVICNAPDTSSDRATAIIHEPYDSSGGKTNNPRVTNSPKKAVSSRGQKGPRPGLFVHDVAQTMAAEIAVVVCGLLIVSILSRWVGAHALSEYLLLRRVLTWMISGLLLGLANGLPRYVAHAAGRREQGGYDYFLAAIICVVPFCAGIGTVLILYRSIFARLLFGGSEEATLIIALALMLIGFAIHRTVYGYYRGLLAMTRANAFEICNLALMPLAVVLALHRTRSVSLMVGVMGCLTVLFSVLFCLPLLREIHQPRRQSVLESCKELLRYGIPRVPGECGVAAFTALGPILAAHYLKLTQILPLLLGLNVLMLCGYAAGPLGVVLLSKLSMMLGEERHEEVRSGLEILLAAVVELSVFSCIQIVIFVDVVLHMWVGPGYLGNLGVIRLVLLSIPSYLFYMTLRSTIDAVTIKACNTANVCSSLLVYFVLIAACIAFFPSQYLLFGIAGSLLCAQVLLGFLTARTFRRLYGLSIPWARLAPSLLIALALGGGAYALRLYSAFSSPWVMVPFEFGLTAFYLAVLAKRGSGWISYAWNAGFRGQTSWS